MSSHDGDELEKALLIAAADADAHSKEVARVSVIKSLESAVESESRGKKRSHEAIEEPAHKEDVPTAKAQPSGGYANVVASHYNQLQEKGLDERSQSRIVFMRNFHNWIKSMQINENLEACKAKKRHNVPLRALDLCCGKGGDLLKWRKGNITHLICSDIAEISLDQCKTRYRDMRERRDRNPGQIFTTEFFAADATKVRLREKYADPSMKLDVISCQFAFHYSFESLPQAECMMRNASECLHPGGFFFGTIPDANEIVARLQKSPGKKSFGNDVFSVTYDGNVAKPALFGSKYNFHLDGVVDCPEFLVHFPTFIALAKRFGLKLVRKEKFLDFYERMKHEGRNLMSAMGSLETYARQNQSALVGTHPDDYAHAEAFLKARDSEGPIGTLSKSEWEASSLYLTFTFEKVKNEWNDNGTPRFIFD